MRLNPFTSKEKEGRTNNRREATRDALEAGDAIFNYRKDL